MIPHKYFHQCSPETHINCLQQDKHFHHRCPVYPPVVWYYPITPLFCKVPDTLIPCIAIWVKEYDIRLEAIGGHYYIRGQWVTGAVVHPGSRAPLVKQKDFTRQAHFVHFKYDGIICCVACPSPAGRIITGTVNHPSHQQPVIVIVYNPVVWGKYMVFNNFDPVKALFPIMSGEKSYFHVIIMTCSCTRFCHPWTFPIRYIIVNGSTNRGSDTS